MHVWAAHNHFINFDLNDEQKKIIVPEWFSFCGLGLGFISLICSASHATNDKNHLESRQQVTNMIFHKLIAFHWIAMHACNGEINCIGNRRSKCRDPFIIALCAPYYVLIDITKKRRKKKKAFQKINEMKNGLAWVPRTPTLLLTWMMNELYEI